MSITTDFDGLWTQKKQDDAAVEAKAQMQNVMNVVAECKTRVDTIIAGGTFNLIPVSVKTALQAAYAVITTANTNFNASADIKEVLNWAGK